MTLIYILCDDIVVKQFEKPPDPKDNHVRQVT